METLAEKEERSDWYTLRSVGTSDSQGAEGLLGAYCFTSKTTLLNRALRNGVQLSSARISKSRITTTVHLHTAMLLAYPAQTNLCIRFRHRAKASPVLKSFSNINAGPTSCLIITFIIPVISLTFSSLVMSQSSFFRQSFNKSPAPIMNVNTHSCWLATRVLWCSVWSVQSICNNKIF